MKKQVLMLLILLPLFSYGQFDFDTRYFTINATSLTEAPQFELLPKFGNTLSLSNKKEERSGSYYLDNTPTFAATLNSFKMSSSNYWEPVDMMNAVSNSSNRLQTNWDIENLKPETYGNSSYSADGASKVKNSVYMEVRGLDLLSPCPPYGICPRCAPYRARGY
ncbi:MAG: hypothetical protein ACI83B_001967 [Sediminicola sp.]|jgi:hypothetical protein|tara:strand:+ start:2460 stop:2951 length:492 start_codon:yes stop_codon:yes gene_type:complete